MASPGSALRVPDVQGGARGTSIGIHCKPIRNATSQARPFGASESQSGFPKSLGEPQVIPRVIKSRGVTEVGVLTASQGHPCPCVPRREGPSCPVPVYPDRKGPLAAVLLYLTDARACARSLQSCPTLCHPADCSPPGSSVHEVLQARILEWVALSSSGGSFLTQGSDAHLSYISCIRRQVLYH